jgi:inosine-uridine nucleoside N-ribohydrolase
VSGKWKLLTCTSLLLSIFTGCKPVVEEHPAENTPALSINQAQVETPPVPATLPTEDIFSDTSGGKIPVIFSHGGGPCDIGALVFLTKNPHVDLIGLVLSNGEFHPINAVDDWSVFLYDVLDYDGAALGLGSEKPLDPNGHEFPAEWRSSADNFWGLELPAPKNEYTPAVGHELIIDLINNSPQKVTILAMGALTDVALALKEDPGIAEHIANIVIMGGAFNMRGNLDEGPDPTSNEVAEWNMYIDPLAAKVVFDSGIPLSIVPLDAIQYHIQSDDMKTINTINDPGVAYVAQMWNQQWGWANGGFFIWDTITATAVTNPENFSWIYTGMDVITEPGDLQGQTIVINNGVQHTRFAIDANYGAILDTIFTIFRGETIKPKPEIINTELAGTWEGFTGSFHITFYLEAECKLNEKCGTFEIAEFSLTGDITFVNINGNKYEFITTNISSGQPGNVYEYLQLLDDGTLKYFSTDLNVTSEAILYRK